jgi:hypothetical protein
MEAGPFYKASAWIVQKTPLPTNLLLLGEVAIRVDCTENTFSVSSAIFVTLKSFYCAVT